jgi:hypothetical protein
MPWPLLVSQDLQDPTGSVANIANTIVSVLSENPDLVDTYDSAQAHLVLFMEPMSVVELLRALSWFLTTLAATTSSKRQRKE